MEERLTRLDAPVMRVTYPDSHVPFSQVPQAANLLNSNTNAAALRKSAEY